MKAGRKTKENNEYGHCDDRKWLPGIPCIVMDEQKNARDPVIAGTDTGKLVLFAECLDNNESIIMMSRSDDKGSAWDAPRRITGTADRNMHMNAGAAGMLSSGRLALAAGKWRETPGADTYTGHRYSRICPRDMMDLYVLLSNDEGDTWTHAVFNGQDLHTCLAASGRIFTADGADWIPVYGAADTEEMDLEISSFGLIKSINGGREWHFSHWIARADKLSGISFGPGEITIMDDGQWMGLLQGVKGSPENHARPRIYRTLSKDGGISWSHPEYLYINSGTSTILSDDGLILVGGSKDRGIVYTAGINSGGDWLYQDQIWSCVWYAPGCRGSARLLKVGQDVIVAYHWMGKEDKTKTAVLTQFLTKTKKAEGTIRFYKGTSEAVGYIWNMAEAYQIPDIPEAFGGIVTKTVLNLKNGGWICVGHTGTGTAYDYIPEDFCILRSPGPEGPWKKIADLPIPDKSGRYDTGSGAGYPVHMARHSSGRLFMPFSTGDRGDIILTCSDDEGMTWRRIGSVRQMTGLPEVSEADIIRELSDGSLIFPLVTGFLKPGTPLVYIRSADRGETWEKPVAWAAHPGTRYEGLPYGRADIRESGLAAINEHDMIGIYRESRGTPLPGDSLNGPCDMPNLCIARSKDGGRAFTHSFGFLGVEPDIAALPGGAVMAAFRDDGSAGVWISYRSGYSWQRQEDPAELPWHTAACTVHTQWPPGGTPVIRTIDDNTVAVICDTGMAPPGKIDTPRGGSNEIYGRVQIRFFRREYVLTDQNI